MNVDLLKALTCRQLVTIVVLLVSGFAVRTNAEVVMKKLIEDLFANYNSDIRPTYDHTQPTKVVLDVGILEMIDMDIKHQVITLHGWMRVQWTDEFLRWDKDEYGNISEIRIPQKKMWKPDLAFTNTLQENNFLETDDGTLITIQSNGWVRWSPAFTRDFYCGMDVSKFPFDEQLCTIGVWPWTATANTVTVVNGQNTIMLGAFKESGEFWIRSDDVKQSYYESSGNRYTQVDFKLKLKRKTFYHGVSVVLPVMLLAIMCCVSFILDPDDDDKLMVALTVLLSVVVFLDVIDDDLPKISDNMASLVIFTSFLMLLGFLAIIGNTLVLKLYKEEEKRGQRKRRNSASLFPPISNGYHPDCAQQDNNVTSISISRANGEGIPRRTSRSEEEKKKDHHGSFLLNRIFFVINVTVIVVATGSMWIYILA